ncbi:PLP-dependent transferase [Pelomyxa schiedti]|nr:PLP-dependent transferase [Pelomyxa schiedti]
MATTTAATTTRDYTKYLSPRCLRRQPSPIRAIMPLTSIPGMISLGGGLPNASTFPFKSINFELKDGTTVSLTGPQLSTALQYSPSYGVKEFCDYLINFQKTLHNPPYAPFNVVVSSGSQDLMCKAFDMLLSEDDYALVESPTYPGAIGAMRPIGCKLVGVPTDDFGLVPEALAEILTNWDATKKRPHVLYIIPNGQNPSGASLSLARKQAIYALACKFDLIILEDDPYYFLNYPTEPPSPPVPSFFSMDTEARVIRLDSFSKVMSSGLRIGFATGPSFLIEKLQLDMQVSLLHTSGVSQMSILSLLTTWGPTGWQNHVKSVQLFYKQRCDLFCSLVEKHLSGLVTWKKPVSGMFLWMKCNGVADTMELIQKRAVQKKVLLVPGESFDPEGKKSSYVRASFSTASDADMEEAIVRLAALLRGD